MLKTIIGKLEKKKRKEKEIMTWTLMQFNWSVATINVTLQFLEILVIDPRDAWKYIIIL